MRKEPSRRANYYVLQTQLNFVSSQTAAVDNLESFLTEYKKISSVQSSNQ